MNRNLRVVRSTGDDAKGSAHPREGIRASRSERRAIMPGDDLLPTVGSAYTLGITIVAARSEVWPWLVQMGQGRGGFYTHPWLERLLGAEIRNADAIMPEFQRLAAGDVVRLTPDPYLGIPGQFMTVAHLKPRRSLVFRQMLPNGSGSTWAFVLQTAGVKWTRLIMRRRIERPTIVDRLLKPAYQLMDAGVLRGIRTRAECVARQARLNRVGLPLLRRQRGGDHPRTG